MSHEPDYFIDKRHYVDIKETNFLTKENAESFNRDGYIVLRDVLPAKLIQSLRDAVEGLLKDNFWLSAPEKFHESYRECLYETIIQDIAKDINGGESEVLLAFLLKSSPGDELFKPWHQDGVYWGGSDSRVFASFIPLSTFDAENGALCVIPGSHRLGRLYHRWDTNPKYRPNTLICDVDCFKEKVVIEANPGDVVLCHSLTLHAAYPNKSSRPRINFGCHWYNKESEVILDNPTKEAYGKV